jgi:hypothetical protein
MMAKGSPISENVAIMESTPVCGVAIRKEVTAPLEAPSLRMDIAVGITPQEHKGKGIPMSAALMTLEKDLRERYLWKYFPGIKVCMIPAIRKPKSR